MFLADKKIYFCDLDKSVFQISDFVVDVTGNKIQLMNFMKLHETLQNNKGKNKNFVIL